MKSFKQFNEAGYTDRYAHQSVENDNVGIFDVANPESLKRVNGNEQRYSKSRIKT